MPVLSILACETIKIPQATGGSRSDAIVELSYRHGRCEKPLVQWDKALVTAKKRCAVWNYTSAEAFGGTVSECQARNGYGNCISYFVTTKYQCIAAQ